jgi:predicted GIY-YIG superfamily endonuclease
MDENRRKTMHYTYVLLSRKDNRFYTGCTNDLEKRLLEHNSGRVTSTAYREPLELIYFEACPGPAWPGRALTETMLSVVNGS